MRLIYYCFTTVVVTVAILPALSYGQTHSRIFVEDSLAYSAFSPDPHRQFDFWIGEWDVNLRVINDQLEFQDRVSARASIYAILNGRAVLELWDSKPIKGYSLRYYSESSQEWILWLNWPGKNKSSNSSLEGKFCHGRGVFLSSSTDAQGNEEIQQYSFSDISPFSLRWDDMASRDGGKTWSQNWRMEFSRTAAKPDWPVNADYLPTYEDGSRCSQEEFRVYEDLVGEWNGHVSGQPATLRGYHVLDGCGVFVFLDVQGEKPGSHFFFLTFETQHRRWETTYLSDDTSRDLYRFSSSKTWTALAGNGNTLTWSVNGGEMSMSAIFRDGAPVSGSFERQ